MQQKSQEPVPVLQVVSSEYTIAWSDQEILQTGSQVKRTVPESGCGYLSPGFSFDHNLLYHFEQVP